MGAFIIVSWKIETCGREKVSSFFSVLFIAKTVFYGKNIRKLIFSFGCLCLGFVCCKPSAREEHKTGAWVGWGQGRRYWGGGVSSPPKILKTGKIREN